MSPDRPGPVVAHVVLSMDVGGLERVVLDLIRLGLDPKTGGRVPLVCLDRPGSLAGEAEAVGAEVVGGNRLVETLRSRGVEIVHTHQIAALYRVARPARQAGVRAIVHTEHGNTSARARTPLDRLRSHVLRGVAARRASWFFCVSQEIKRASGAYGLVPRSKLEVVPNGIDTSKAQAPGALSKFEARASLGLEGPGPVVGTLGRLTEVKRQDVLIRGFARLATRRPDARLVLIGDGEERSNLEALADRLAIRDRVHFAGYRADPERVLPALDVFALTSRSEGMPLSILEAWSAGLPVVASKVGGIPDLIENNGLGLLFEAGDDQALASRLDALLGDPDRLDRLGRSGRDRVRDRHDSTVMARTYDRLYREALADRQSPRGA